MTIRYSDVARVAYRKALIRLRENHSDEFSRLWNEEKAQEMAYYKAFEGTNR